MHPELVGDLVALVPVAVDDVDPLFEIARDPASIEDFQRAARSRDDVLAWLRPALDGEELAWTVRVGGAIVGFVGLEPDGPVVGATTAEVGYFVDARHTGNGYATDAELGATYSGHEPTADRSF